MKSNNIISLTEARKKIFQIADNVQKANSRYTLTKNGKAKVVMLSSDDFDAWVETVEILRDFPYIIKEVKKAEKARKSGAYKKYTRLEKYI